MCSFHTVNTFIGETLGTFVQCTTDGPNILILPATEKVVEATD